MFDNKILCHIFKCFCGIFLYKKPTGSIINKDVDHPLIETADKLSFDQSARVAPQGSMGYQGVVSLYLFDRLNLFLVKLRPKA